MYESRINVRILNTTYLGFQEIYNFLSKKQTRGHCACNWSREDREDFMMQEGLMLKDLGWGKLKS